MEPDKARRIIAALANGIDPATGEVVADESPLQHPEVVRALMSAARALEARPSKRDRADLPANAGKPWSGEEDARLLAAFDAGRTPRDLAEQHGRTIAGVEARLERHGRLDSESRTTSRRYPLRNDGSGATPRAARLDAD